MSTATTEKRANNRVEMTERWLNSKEAFKAVPENGRKEWVDKRVQGLVLRVSRHGDELPKTWMVRYRPKGLSQKRIAIGEYGPSPRLTLEAARNRARKIVAAARDGVDLPAKEADDRRRAAQEADARRRAADRPETVADLLDRYIEKYCKPNQRRWKIVERMFENHVKSTALGKKRLVEVRRADVVELLDDLQNTKGLAAQVNRVRSQLIAAFNWSVDREWIDVNPAATIKKRKVEKPRGRKLQDDELRAVWRAAEKIGYPGGDFVKFLVLTGQRRDEVRCLPRTELNMLRRIWTLPEARNKSKREHDIPLTPPMIDLIEKAPTHSPFIFTVSGKRPYAGQKRLKEILDRESSITGWTLHDIRRTVESGMRKLRIDKEVVRRTLNHGQDTIAKIYDKHEYEDEKREALEKWANHVEFIVGDGRGADNVVPIAERRAAS